MVNNTPVYMSECRSLDFGWFLDAVSCPCVLVSHPSVVVELFMNDIVYQHSITLSQNC